MSARQKTTFMNRSLKLVFVSALLLLCWTLATAGEVWRNAEHRVSFLPPNGWKSGAVSAKEELALWESPDGGAEISISVSECEKQPEELDEFLGELASSCSVDGGKVVEARKLPAGNRELGVVVIRTEQMGFDMVTHTSVVLAHDKVYYVMGICQSDAYPELRSVLESSSRTLLVD